MRAQPATRSRTASNAVAAKASRRSRDEDEEPVRRRGRPVETRGRKTTRRATKTSAPVTAGLRPIREKFTKRGLYEHIAEKTNLTVKEVKSVLEEHDLVVLASIMPRGLGEFTNPGFYKIVGVHKKAVKGGVKKISPFTGEPFITKAKPATIRCKVRPQRKLKMAILGQ